MRILYCTYNILSSGYLKVSFGISSNATNNVQRLENYPDIIESDKTMKCFLLWFIVYFGVSLYHMKCHLHNISKWHILRKYYLMQSCRSFAQTNIRRQKWKFYSSNAVNSHSGIVYVYFRNRNTNRDGGSDGSTQ